MERIVENIAKIIWGPWLIGLLVGVGVYFMFAMHFSPAKMLFPTLRKILSGKGDSSSVNSLFTSLGAAMGTGNIVGVATALVLGGPGAMLWMMLSGFLGLATCMVECAICARYKVIDSETKEYTGGPMYVLINNMKDKKAGKVLGYVYAALVVLTGFGMGNMTQSNSFAMAINIGTGIPVTLIGIILAVCIMFLAIRGSDAVFKINSVLVPLMSVLYLSFCLLIIFINFRNIPICLNAFVEAAFKKNAILGGIFGNLIFCRSKALRLGISRGVMSNEAGLGTAGICAAHSTNPNYIEQAYISMCSVFVDTIVVCFVSGLAFSVSGLVGARNADGKLLLGAELCRAIFGNSFGHFGEIILTFCVVLFALATIISWTYQGKEAFRFIFRGKYEKVFIVLFSFAAFIGAVYPLEMVWNIADICNGMLVVPNMVCLIMFSGKIIKEVNRNQKK